MSNAPIIWGGASSAANSSTASNLQNFLRTNLIGSSPAFPKNYLNTWYFFNQDPTVGIVTTLTATGNRAANTTFWGSSTSSLLTYVTSSANYLRPPASAQIAVTGAAGAQFVESPMFTLDNMDVGGTVYFSFDCSSSGTFASGDIDFVIVNYNSSGTYVGLITPTTTLIPSNKNNVAGTFTATSTASDQYAVRWRSQNASARTIIVDSLFVGTQTTNVITPTFGTYTPTVSNAITFFSSTQTVRQHNYVRTGNIVFVSGRTEGTGTSSNVSQFEITLPVATANFSTIYQAQGTVGNDNIGLNISAGRVQSVSGAQRVLVEVAMSGSSVTNSFANYVFSYQIQ